MNIGDILGILLVRYMWGTISVPMLPAGITHVFFSISVDLDRGPSVLRNMSQEAIWQSHR